MKLKSPNYNHCKYFVLFGISIFFTPTAFAETEFEIKEWIIPTPNSSPHDIIVAKDGNVWFTEISSNKIGSFDPVTTGFQEWHIPTYSSRPHGLTEDSQGNIWFTEVGASKIGKFNPNTEEFQEFQTPTANSGPHTPIFADENTLWFTEQGASQIGRMDIITGTIEEFPTITPSANPYGITIDSEGNAWFAELQGQHIGKVDSASGKVSEFSPLTDNSGPRRISVDSNGILWFTQFNVGKISSYDPIKDEMKEYNTSSQSSGPYAIWVDQFDNVWFSMTGSYKIGKLDQKNQEITEFEMPSPQTHIKFVRTDSEGNLWFPNYNNNKIGVLVANSENKMVLSNDQYFHENSSPMTIQNYDSPIKQVKSGIEPSNVQCKQDFQLVLKVSNGNHACVKTSSIEKLMDRGWAIHILSDPQKIEDSNSEIFTPGNFQVETIEVNYFQNANGYLAKPTGDDQFPAVVMIHEVWGLNENIREIAKKLASHGYVVLAVDLYDGNVANSSEEARSLRGSFDQQYWTENMNSASKYLEENYHPQKMGSIGWCFGGGQSLNLALNNDSMDATVIYYGQLVTDPEVLSSINWPVLGIFAELDQGIPPETVIQFESTLNSLEIQNDINIYPQVNHAFANPTGERYAPEAAMDAWKKTISFFEMNLK